MLVKADEAGQSVLDSTCCSVASVGVGSAGAAATTDAAGVWVGAAGASGVEVDAAGTAGAVGVRVGTAFAACVAVSAAGVGVSITDSD